MNNSSFPLQPETQQGDLWPSPPRLLTIKQNEVHLWRVPLNSSESDLFLSHPMLSPDEKIKAARFRFENDKCSYLVSHGALRQILGAYMNMEPASLEFECNHQGKPFLKEGSGSHSIQFNLSHSREYALIAVALERAVGIDIEHINGNIGLSEITRYFSIHERELIERLPPGEQQQAFYNCWTRKEAYIKARGDGLAYKLDQFEVSMKPGETAMLISNKKDPGEVSRWRMEDVKVAPGYAAAIVVEGRDWISNHWHWNGQFSA